MKAFIIRVIQDLDGPKANAEVRYSGPNLWDVRLPRREEDSVIPGPMFAIAAHELGHVVACEFGLPASRLDYRMGAFFEKDQLTHDKIDPFIGVYNSEREAWNVADLMVRYRDCRWLALNSYNPLTRAMATFDPKITEIKIDE